MKTLFFLVMIVHAFFIHAWGQKVDYSVTNMVTVVYNDYFVYAHFSADEEDIKIDDEKIYYWYAANDIKKTRGGYDGKILHGLYTAFYKNKNLMEKGMFSHGLKKGVWKSWYLNGELKEKSFYKRGTKNKAFLIYHDNGRVKQRGTFKNGAFHKKIKTYDSTGILIKTDRYKDGIIVKEEIKKPKGKIWRLLKRNKKTLDKAALKTDKIDSQKKEAEQKNERKAVPEGTKKKEETKQLDKEAKKKEKEKVKQEKKKKKEQNDIRIQKIKKIVPAGKEGSSI
ncbi:MAG TPA: hypothetical protein VK750_06575 [Cytophagaceae bacterium]|jgi:hypothetical protein|nr:hypothetical protein [Cytophagaceae bacterium]